MIVRTAGPDDLDRVIELFSDASAWLASRGIDQWQRGPRVDQVRRDIEQGHVFVGLDDDQQIVATATVDTYADPDFWGPDDNPTSALYVHRMIVDRDHAGLGLGDELTGWIEQFAGALGYDRVRLDCWRSNTALHNYYKSRGWEHVRTVDAPWRPSGALFQRLTTRALHRIADENTTSPVTQERKTDNID